MASKLQLESILAQCEASVVARGSLFAKSRLKLVGRSVVLQLSTEGNPEVEVEDTIQQMLEGLEHEVRSRNSSLLRFFSFLTTRIHFKETIVRWTAAKYLARIAERLPQEASSEIVEALLANFDSGETPEDGRASENIWHGSCLALAEVARRDRIPDALVGELLDCILRVRSLLYIPSESRLIQTHATGSLV